MDRKKHIDVCRGIAIILMVFGHLGIKSVATQFVYSFHMPLFFVITGMTIHVKEETMTQYCLKRIKSLLVPFVIFSFIFSAGELKDFAFSLYGSRASILKASSFTPLWFLPCLFTADIVFQGIDRINKNVCKGGDWLTLGFCALISTLGFFMCANPVFSMKWPFGVDVAMVSVIFVWFGYFTEQNLRKHVEKLKIWQNCLISILLLVIVFCLSMHNLPTSVTEGFNHVEMSIGSYGNIGLFIITALFGSFAIVCLSTLIKSRYLSMMGQSTMTCLVTHGIEISAVSFILSRLGVESLYIRSLISLCVVLIATIPINAILLYLCPNIIGKQYNCATSAQRRNSREIQQHDFHS